MSDAYTAAHRLTSTSGHAPAKLVAEGLYVNYGGVAAVRGVSFTVEIGQAVGIIGANGAGKTSTLKAVLGLVNRRADKLAYGNVDLTRTHARKIVREGIGYVPEGRHVFGGLTVEKNLLLGAYIQRWNAETRAQLSEVYEIFPVLAEMRTRLAGALSGGQQQMLAIGRALMSKPRLLVLDEPSMGLSPKLVDEVLAVVQRLNAAEMGILLVEQNAKLTFEATTYCYVMENGRIEIEGSADDLRADPRVRKIYLGI
ncbi:ABC transporter ATP-binding protein [Microbacterium protaetiae]|uniref:ABC transporter ATP-binding protein n=1 Tax=Microbacterium protaetiae TaxID=2509458 RepID=A0A4P6EDZ7_9MICO|nr:ABC transporter ATP-binding protein [Microbacterium protaetiae]QAY59299.1 ABC transporter ATP-binding protein [Microbacterium protaetiae]